MPVRHCALSVGLAVLGYAGAGVFAGDPPVPADQSVATASTSESERSCAVFDEACELVATRFYDRKLHGVDWAAVRAELGPIAAAARGRAAISAVINQALDRLHASHTRHYTPDQREYYEVLDVFHPTRMPLADAARGATIRYVGIGLVSRVIGDRTFVADVYPGGPADSAGIHVGDELVAVYGTGGAGGPPPAEPTQREWSDVSPFRGRENHPTTVIIQRTPDPASRRSILVTPERIVPHEMFLTALERSAKVIEQPASAPGSGLVRRLAYVRPRSYANPSYQRAIVRLIAEEFARCDGLILDLRGGWGGAKPDYLNAFNPAGVAMTMSEGEEWRTVSDAAWSGPMVALIDGGTRSGKEVLSHGLKKRGRARLVGERTCGAVLGGSAFVLSDGSAMMIAVSDVRVDGIRLEGVGVEPDVVVHRDLPYCDGRDEQLDAGVAELLRIIPEGSPSAPPMP